MAVKRHNNVVLIGVAKNLPESFQGEVQLMLPEESRRLRGILPV